MSEENNTPEGNEPQPPNEEPSGEVSNSDIKANPVFQKVTSELKALREEKEQRERADQDAKSKAEQDALVAKGEFEQALALQKQQFEEQQTKFNAELLQRDLKTELLKTGFQNDVFINGAVASFNGESDGVAEYVHSLASNEANAAFLGGVIKREVLDGTNKLSIKNGTLSVEKLRQMATDKDSTPDARSKARMALLEKYESG